MAVLFDLDGTLLDHQHAVEHGLRSLLMSSSACRAEAPADLGHLWEAAEMRHFQRYERGEIDYASQRRERLREIFPRCCAGLSNDELDGLFVHYLAGYEKAWRLYPDALHVLESLGAEKVGLVTNGNGDLQRRKISALALDDFVDEIVISGEVGVAKPDKRIFELTCERLGVIAEKSTYIGDNFHNDVEGSARAGMRAVWINRERRPAPPSSYPFEEIASLAELRFPARD